VKLYVTPALAWLAVARRTIEADRELVRPRRNTWNKEPLWLILYNDIKHLD
jgi:hypothetical protein